MKGCSCRSVVTSTASPKRSRDVTVTGGGSADEAVVVVKQAAVDGPEGKTACKCPAIPGMEAKGGTSC